jgi:2-phosphoglycerate kinase
LGNSVVRQLQTAVLASARCSLLHFCLQVTQNTLYAQKFAEKAREDDTKACGQVGTEGPEYVAVVEDYVIKAAQSVGIPGARTMTAQQALMEIFGKIAKWKQSGDGNGGERISNQILGL